MFGNAPLNSAELTAQELAEADITARAFFHFIMSLDITNFRHEEIPKTKARVDCELEATPMIARWLFKWLSGDSCLQDITRAALFKLYQGFCRDNDETPVTATGFGRYINGFREIDLATTRGSAGKHTRLRAQARATLRRGLQAKYAFY